MTKYLSGAPFSVASSGTKKWRDNWSRIFERADFVCDMCGMQFKECEPDPEGTNQDVACPSCHHVETRLV